MVKQADKITIMTMTRSELDTFFCQLLSPDKFADYGPNGLQIEGNDAISRIAFAVSATAESISQAVSQEAQALVVHHGLFWKFHGSKILAGAFAQRVFPLVRHYINLFAYHLPLDGHAEVGNAAVLGRYIGLTQQSSFGDYKGCPTGVQGQLEPPVTARQLQQQLTTVLAHPVLLATPNENAWVSNVGIITGGANSEWRQALTQGLDAYITGEMSEHDWHESQEAGIHMYAGGHNATEQFGIQALMQQVQAQFSVDCFFIPSINPA